MVWHYIGVFKVILGKFLASASDDDSVCIYDCETGERSKLLYSKKYGVDQLKFVHSGPISAVCASRNEFDCMSEIIYIHLLCSLLAVLGPV